MNPLDWITSNLRLAGIAAAVIAGASALYWLSDKIGDSRELDVKTTIAKQEKRTNEAEIKGRNRARACHALGPDRLWNVEHEECGFVQPVRSPGR